MSSTTIPRIRVRSSSLAAIGHNAEENVLVVEFVNGSVYRYLDVPAQTYQQLLRAESKGAYFNRLVRTRFGYERLTEHPASG